MYDEQQVEVTELFKIGQELFEIAKLAEEKQDWQNANCLLDHALSLQKEAVRCMPQIQTANRIRIYQAAITTAMCRRKYQEVKKLIKEALPEMPEGDLRKDLEETYCILEHTAC